MKNVYLILMLISSQIIVPQKNMAKNTVLDFETLKPISSVNIFNKTDNTISNSDGVFVFISNNNLVTINHLGYESMVTDFEYLKKNDTIFLKASIYNLNEIVISDNKKLIEKVYENVSKNYPFTEFAEESFIRCILRKDGKIIKFQDMVLNIKRNSLFTNQNTKILTNDVHIINLRKAGIKSKSSKEEDFELLSIDELYNWFSAIFTIPTYYNYNKELLNSEKKIKIVFSKNEKLKEQKSLEGYYVVNLEDYSFGSVYYNTVFHDQSLIPFFQNKHIKWRTIVNELSVDYKKILSEDKYFINSGTLRNVVEVINTNKKSIYEASYQIINVKNNANLKVKSNFSASKDLFKAKSEFNSVFWETQNQLLLDNELSNFLKNLINYKDEYEIYSNF